MDSMQFDALARMMARPSSRHGLLRGLLGGAVGGTAAAILPARAEAGIAAAPLAQPTEGCCSLANRALGRSCTSDDECKMHFAEAGFTECWPHVPTCCAGVCTCDGCPLPVVPIHPIVGAWRVDIDTKKEGNPEAVFVFHADGTIVQLEFDAKGGGTWSALDEAGVEFTTVSIYTPEAGGVIILTARGKASVWHGDMLTAEYTVELKTPDGTSTSQLGPGYAEGHRVFVESMGKPVAPLP